MAGATGDRGALGVGAGAAGMGAPGASAGGKGGLVEASNCCGVRMATDTRSSSSRRFGGFGSGINITVAASSACRRTEVEIPQGEASFRTAKATGLRKLAIPALCAALPSSRAAS